MSKRIRVREYKHVYFEECPRGIRTKKPYLGEFTKNSIRYRCGNFETLREAALAVDNRLISLRHEPVNILKSVLKNIEPTYYFDGSILVCYPYGRSNMKKMEEALELRKNYYVHGQYKIPKYRSSEISAKSILTTPEVIARIKSGKPPMN